MNRREVLCSIAALPLLSIPATASAVTVEKGIRFLSDRGHGYHKTVYYCPTYIKKMGWDFGSTRDYMLYGPSIGGSSDLHEPPSICEPTDILTYANVIKQQRELGFPNWELITDPPFKIEKITVDAPSRAIKAIWGPIEG